MSSIHIFQGNQFIRVQKQKAGNQITYGKTLRLKSDVFIFSNSVIIGLS